MEKKNYIKQIPIYDKHCEYHRLIEFLKEKNYNITYSLHNIKNDDHIVAIIIDLELEDVWESNVTCMAAWCRNGTRRPLKVQEFVENYDELVINNNFNKYYELIQIKER